MIEQAEDMNTDIPISHDEISFAILHKTAETSEMEPPAPPGYYFTIPAPTVADEENETKGVIWVGPYETLEDAKKTAEVFILDSLTCGTEKELISVAEVMKLEDENEL